MFLFITHFDFFMITFVKKQLTMLDYLKKIAIGSDHAGYDLKEILKKDLLLRGYEVKDFGTYSEQSMDYPETAHPLAFSVDQGEFEKGILICGSGNGMAMVANKYRGIRAAICWNDEITRLARQHNDANILALPARFISSGQALEFTRIFLSTDFEGGRHERRVEKISGILQKTI